MNKKEEEEAVARRMTADKRRKMAGCGGVDTTTNRQTRDEGSNEEGKNGKGNSNTTTMVAMDGAMVMVMDGNDGNDGNGRRNGDAMVTEGAIVTQRQ